MTQEEKQPQTHQDPGQPTTYLPERKSLSAMPLVSDEQFEKNKRIIAQYRMFQLEQAVKKEDAK